MINRKEIKKLISQFYLTKFYFHTRFLDENKNLSLKEFEQLNLFLTNFFSNLGYLSILTKKDLFTDKDFYTFSKLNKYIYALEDMFDIKFKENIENIDSMERKEYLSWLEKFHYKYF